MIDRHSREICCVGLFFVFLQILLVKMVTSFLTAMEGVSVPTIEMQEDKICS